MWQISGKEITNHGRALSAIQNMETKATESTLEMTEAPSSSVSLLKLHRKRI